MATARIPIMGAVTVPDNSGDVYPSRVDSELTLGTSALYTGCIVFEEPSGTDLYLYGSFTVPNNYSSGGTIRVTSISDGSNTGTVSWGFQHNIHGDDDAFDVAAETATEWTDTSLADEDVMISTSGSLNGTFVAGEIVPFRFYREDGSDTCTDNMLVLNIEFEYTTT